MKNLLKLLFFQYKKWFYLSQYLPLSNVFLDPCSAPVLEFNLKLIKDQAPDEFLIWPLTNNGFGRIDLLLR